MTWFVMIPGRVRLSALWAEYPSATHDRLDDVAQHLIRAAAGRGAEAAYRGDDEADLRIGRSRSLCLLLSRPPIVTLLWVPAMAQRALQQPANPAFVPIKGSPYARFRRALETRKLPVVLAAASELQHMRLDDALEVLILMEQEKDPRFERAAARWVGRVLTETPPMTLKAIAAGASSTTGMSAV